MSGANFFDFQRQLKRRPEPAAALSKSGAADDAMSPSQLNRLVESTLKAGLPTTVLVRGELSNFNRNRTSGHCYFTLKDANGAIDAVMWASRAERLRFDPRDGMELLASGNVGVYVPRGRYQLNVNSLDPIGEGALELAKRQLESKLREEGLLDEDRKRRLPPFPRRIAIVSSPQAAGFADVLKVLRRFPWLQLYLYPVPVQGKAAAPAIAAALRHLSAKHRTIGGDGEGIDAILLGRGGGSLEDLWAFNEETVARAMSDCAVPIVTGIGHDVDVSIADLVADHHAHTPTEAATYLVRNWSIASEIVDGIRSRLGRELRRRLDESRQQIASIARHEFFRRPASIFDNARQRVDDAGQRLSRSLERRLAAAQRRLDRAVGGFSPRLAMRPQARAAERVERLARAVRAAHDRRLSGAARGLDAIDARLRALSPDNVLRRGYSITTRKRDGSIVRTPADVRGGETLLTRLADGAIESTADDPKQPKLF